MFYHTQNINILIIKKGGTKEAFYNFYNTNRHGMMPRHHPMSVCIIEIIESFLSAPLFYYQDVNVLCVIKHPDNVINNTKTGV